MSKIIIDEQILLDRIAELKQTSKKYPLLHEILRSNNNLVKELNSILQQGEEYNENEAVEFTNWCSDKFRRTYPTQKVYEHKDGEALWFPNNILRDKFEKRIYHTQELFKLYKNEGKIN